MMAAARIDQDPGFVHVPVMLPEVLAAVRPLARGVFVDATAGGGGHSKAILEALPAMRLHAFDRDPVAVTAASEAVAPFGERASVTHAAFDEIEAVLAERGITQVDGVLADLGVSSEQLTNAERGMSFRGAGPLDMRMDTTRGETARELIERVSQDELADLIYELADERASRRIARCIKQALAAERLNDTLDLRRAVVRAVGPKRFGSIDPATRTFQALRMAVNDEVGQLRTLIAFAKRALRPGGVLTIISFHSLEDRAVKREFQQRLEWQPLTKKPLMPSDAEVHENPSARSAKLRSARRLVPGEGDDEGIEDVEDADDAEGVEQ
jgi:16S rRNA (cytosine1402-N4)-methyltransferase